MKTIHKYPIHKHCLTSISLPQGYKVLTVGIDPHKEICVWVEFEKGKKPTEYLYLNIVGTGWEIESVAQEYVGTVFDSDMYVWHVYKEV